MSQLFDFIEDVVVWVKDRHGRYRWVNRAFRLNFSLEQPQAETPQGGEPILGKTDYDLSPAFLADQFRLDDEQVLSGTRIINRIELVGNSGQSAAWNVTNKIPCLNAQGEIIGTAGMTRRVSSNDQEISVAPSFGPVLAYLRDHFQDPITNLQLANIAHMSLRSFERQFFSAFHLTPQKYLRRLRLSTASRALIYSHKTLSEVALSCGFADQSHFTHEFRRYFGRTPRDYRMHYNCNLNSDVSGINSAGSGQ